jgi:hypothetical protein
VPVEGKCIKANKIAKIMIEKMRKNSRRKRKKMAGNEGKLKEGGEKSGWKRRERYYPKYFPISARRNDWREC